MAKGTLWDANTLKLMKALRCRLMSQRHGTMQHRDDLLVALGYAVAALEREISNAKKT
jgi:hypothetical protein